MKPVIDAAIYSQTPQVPIQFIFKQRTCYKYAQKGNLNTCNNNLEWLGRDSFILMERIAI
jgi:hypothetical protein